MIVLPPASLPGHHASLLVLSDRSLHGHTFCWPAKAAAWNSAEATLAVRTTAQDRGKSCLIFCFWLLSNRLGKSTCTATVLRTMGRCRTPM